MSNDSPNGLPVVRSTPNPDLAKGKKTINMKCRSPQCGSITAVEIIIPTPDGRGHQRLYQCTECGHPMPVNVGGGVSL